LEFCPKCGSLLQPRKVDGKVCLICPNCGYVKDAEGSKLRIVRKLNHSEDKGIIVVDSDKLPKVLPKTKAICPRCGNNEAYWWMVQTRSGDESSTRFFRCTKCGYTWREYE